MKIGKTVRDIRLSAGLTQADLAKMMKCHFTTISQMENDHLRIGAKSVIKFCRAMKVPLWFLIAAGSDARDLQLEKHRYKGEFVKIMQKMRGSINK